MNIPKLLIYPRELRIAKKLREQLRDAGYILVPEDQVGSIRVVEPLPNLELGNADTTWLVQNLLDLILGDTFSDLPKKLGNRLIKRLQGKVDEAAGVKPNQQVKKAS